MLISLSNLPILPQNGQLSIFNLFWRPFFLRKFIREGKLGILSITFRDMGIKCFLINGDICHIYFRDMGYFQNMGYWDPHPPRASYWAVEGNVCRL